MLMPIDLYAYCSQPSAPYFKPSKPTVPFCVNEWSNTHTCDDFTIQNYNNNLESYRYEVQNYVIELQRYVDNAVAYANCEIDNLE